MDDFDKKIRKIMIHRKPECWLDDIFSNLTEYIIETVKEFKFYKLNDIVYFEYNIKNNKVFFRYDDIYFILHNKYHCNNLQIHYLIQQKSEKYLNIKDCQTQTPLTLSFIQ